MRSLVAIAVLMAVPLCAAVSGTVEQAAANFEQPAAKVPGPLGDQFRALGAKASRSRHPKLAQKLGATAVDSQPAMPRATPAPSDAAAAIIQKLRQFRGLPTDADRARLAIDVASEIRALPEGVERLSLARGLCGRATEGELGLSALTAVAETLAESMKGAERNAGIYLELASLVRYEHVRTALADPALDAALALLELRERLHQEAGFSLTALDGESYSLSGLRGKVVLLNFWATWCPPCRKEMPDMEKLYRKFGKKGFVVLAVSDEKRETVEKFLADKNYSFPVLLDAQRKVNTDFDIEGIPKTLLFDREGNIVAQSIDMRTESQFRAMLKSAGLE